MICARAVLADRGAFAALGLRRHEELTALLPPAAAELVAKCAAQQQRIREWWLYATREPLERCMPVSARTVRLECRQEHEARGAAAPEGKQRCSDPARGNLCEGLADFELLGLQL